MKGIIVASDKSQEHLLPFFYLNLRLCSNLPITFFDLGMSIIGREFCEKRGPVIAIDHSLSSCNDHTKIMWFKKPLAFYHTPYSITLWVDLDCKIRQPLDDLVNLKDHVWLKIYEDPHAIAAHTRHKKKHPHYRDFNSGVVVFRKNSPFILQWILKSAKKNSHVRGDQDILSLILIDHLTQVEPLTYRDNHLFTTHIDYCFNQTRIIHYYGNSKKILESEYQLLKNQNLKPLTPSSGGQIKTTDVIEALIQPRN
jgi:hypothetical protein